jgi:hypothetical protein
MHFGSFSFCLSSPPIARAAHILWMEDGFDDMLDREWILNIAFLIDSTFSSLLQHECCRFNENLNMLRTACAVHVAPLLKVQ